MGAGLVQASHTDTSFTIVNLPANRDFTVTGFGFTYGTGAAGIVTLTGGTITSIVASHGRCPADRRFTGSLLGSIIGC